VIGGRLIVEVEQGRAPRRMASGKREQFSQTSAPAATFLFIFSLALLIALEVPPEVPPEVPRYLDLLSGVTLS
jgi:hypothetical protein